MRRLVLLSLGVIPGVSGCEVFQHTVCAPKLLVETCLQEAWPASHVGFGPGCASLNEWAKLHDYAFGGGPPLTPQPQASELKALEAK